LDSTYSLEAFDKDALEDLSQSADLHLENTEIVEQLVFGITPAAYDDGYAIWAGDRPDYFSDIRVRQAVAACLKPSELNLQVLGEKFPEDLLPQEADWTAGFDAAMLLDEAGWKDTDGDPSTPRMAQNVNGAADRTPMSLVLYTSQSELDQQAAEQIVARLGDCGIQVNWQALPSSELYAPGPDGVLFGRKFDLALVSWQMDYQETCRLYLSNAVPSQENYWIGTNLAGFADLVYDLACGEHQLQMKPLELQDPWEVIKAYLPAVPLLPHPILWASRPELNLDKTIKWDQLETFSLPVQ